MGKLDMFDGVVPFVTIVELGSFQRAATALGVTRSAISKALARLEANVGVRLLHRSARSVSLTAEGEELLRACRDAVDVVRAASVRLEDARQVPRGLLRVSLPGVLGARIVAALPRLLADHPELSLDVSTTDRFVRLADERIDVAIRLGALGDSANVARKLRELELFTCASPRYLRSRGVPRTPPAPSGSVRSYRKDATRPSGPATTSSGFA